MHLQNIFQIYRNKKHTQYIIFSISNFTEINAVSSVNRHMLTVINFPVRDWLFNLFQLRITYL